MLHLRAPLLGGFWGVSRVSLIIMTTKELSRLDVMQGIESGRYSVTDAAILLRLSRGHTHRVLRAFRSEGAAGLVSKRRGQPSNRRYNQKFKDHVVGLVRDNYPDFGPTLAGEKLEALHNVKIAKETLRTWMIEAGIWTSRRERGKRVYQPRNRRECFGELIQIDGSDHYWFEDRNPTKCTLLVYIDDATSRLMHLEFVVSESTFDYMRATRTYIDAYGKPLAFYSDRHSIFRVNAKGAVGGDNMTQFSRALHELNIEIICANSSQAKGRVERANLTLQDRLVKELRLEGISTMEEANKYLPTYIEQHNARFAKPPLLDKDLHRPLAPHDNPDTAFAVKEARTVSNSLTLQYDRVRFILEPNEVSLGLRRKKVMIHDYPDGRVEICHKGQSLPYRTFGRIRHMEQGGIVENKRLSAVLAQIKERQHETDHIRSTGAVRRRGQGQSIFS